MANGRLFACMLLLSLGATLLATPAQSHDGGENSQGCHNDARTGEYHCHTPTKPQPQPRTEVSVTYCTSCTVEVTAGTRLASAGS